MIGFAPLASGPLASGPISSPSGLQNSLPGGTSRRYGFTPIPGYNIPDQVPPKPRKPHRPIWDIAQQSGKIERPKPAPFVPAPPPSNIFQEPAPPIDLSKLPSFNQFIPPDLNAMRAQAEQAREMSDALAALKVLLAKRTLH